MPQSRRPQAPPPGPSWRRWLPWLGVPLALLVLVLAVQAQAQPSSPAPNHKNTHSIGPTVDIVPPAPKTPTPTPSPWVDVPVAPPVAYTPKPPVHVLRVVTTVTPLNATTLCMPDDTNSFLIRATITISNPVGGTVTYRWVTNDGFLSAPLKAVFQPGQTTQTVTDTWTMGSMYADGRGKWEQAVVSGPNAVRSNRATFAYSCPAIISGLQVQALRAPLNCGYDVTATVTVFAPAGGSLTYEWKNTDDSGTHTLSQTIVVPPGQRFAQAVAKWHIGAAPGESKGGVTVTTDTGMTLDSSADPATGTDTGTPTASPTPTPSPSPTDTATPTDAQCYAAAPTPVTLTNLTNGDQTLGDLTINKAVANLDQDNLNYNCLPADPAQPQQFTYYGQIEVDTSKLTQPVTLTYHWIRPDGTVGPDEQVTVNPPDATNTDPAHTRVDLPADAAWTLPLNPEMGAYAEQIVITAVNGQTLDTPFYSAYSVYTVLCAPQPPAPQTN